MDALLQWIEPYTCYLIGFGVGVLSTVVLLVVLVAIYHIRACIRANQPDDFDEESSMSEKEYAALLNDTSNDPIDGPATVGVAAFGVWCLVLIALW
jgi:hypothetical protein